MLQRTVLMVKPAQYKKLSQLASNEGVSVAEINRRAIDAYSPEMSKTSQELEQLAEIAIQLSEKTLKQIHGVHKHLRTTINSLKHKE